jgi:adenosylmethionine-8-amino-7-oxononanoate aminotransferase
MKHVEVRELLKKDLRCLWHPYTQMKDFEERDLFFVDRARGVYLYNSRGERFYDTISSWWCVVHGHNHPVIREEVVRQLERLDQVHFAGTTHEGAIRLAEKIVSATPRGLDRVFYSDDGSTACEVAVKMSVQYWHQEKAPGRNRLLSLEHGYHGDTIGMLGLGGVPFFKGPFDALAFDSIRLPAPWCYRCPAGAEAPEREPGLLSPGRLRCDLECLEKLRRTAATEGEGIAALILEPLMIGAGGMIIYPVEYLQEAAAICRRHGIHIIFDEIATGFGRTGRFFALEHAGVTPDFLCISKGLTAGTFPLAATVTSEEIYRSFYADYSEGRTFFHGHTFTGNPVGCAAALGSFRVFEEENVMAGLAEKIGVLHGRAAEIAEEFDFIGDVRGLGMVAAFELVRNPGTGEPFDSSVRAGWQVYLESLKHGIILRPLGDVIYVLPPLCVTVPQLEDIMDRCLETFRKVRFES